MTEVKNFKSALLRDMQFKLEQWEIDLNEDGDISVNIGADEDLKVIYELSPSIMWMIIAEVPYPSEPVNIWFSSENCSESYCFKI